MPEFQPRDLDLLLVEDNPGDVDLIREHLIGVRGASPHLEVRGTLADALDRVGEEPVDAVLLDLNLPDSSGLDTLERLLEGRPHTPVVVLTGIGGGDLGGEAVRRGAAEFILKDDITGRLLLRSVRFALERQHRRQIETRFRALIEQSRDLIAVLGSDFSFQYLSPSVRRLLGFEPDELVGTDPTELVHPDDREEVVRELRRVLDDPAHVARVQYRIRHRDGSWRSFDSIGQNRRDDPAIEGILVNSRDITELRETEEKLHQSRNLLYQLVEAVPDGMWVKDRSGRYELVNEAEAEYHGRRPDEVVGRTDRELEEPDKAREVVRQDRTVMEEGRPRTYEETVPQSDGTNRTYLVTKGPLRDREGAVAGVFGISRDITELKRAQSNLQERVKELRTLYQASRELARAELSLESRLKNLVELLPDGWLHPEVTEARITYEGESVETAGFRETPWTLSEEIVAGDRVAGRVEVVLTEERAEQDRGPFLDEEEELLEAVALAVGEAVRRRRLETEFRQAQKMEAVGRLSGGIAHDFNNLLTVIRAHSDFLLMELVSTGPLAEEVEAIRQAADQAATLTNQLLAFSKEQVLRPEVVDLNEVIGSIHRLLARVLGEDVRLEMRLGDEVSPIRVDPGQLEQALLNLAVNARDAMPEGGTLTFETTTHRLGPAEAAVQPNLEPGTYARLSVSDTGVGMGAETREKIFEPFFTSKEDRTGTGLGLAMVHGFVEQSGGSIQVESTPGEGTRFTIHLPATDETPVSIEKAEASALNESDATGRILVIEDDNSVRRVTCAILERAGFEVAGVEAAERGWKTLRDGGGDFDVVLTDLLLPEMGGRELIDRLMKDRPDLPVVAMSGYAEGSPGRRENLPAEVHFIQKPFSPDALLAVVEEALTTGRQ